MTSGVTSKGVRIPPARASLNLSGVHLKVALWSCHKNAEFTLASRVLQELSTFMYFTYTVTARCYGFDGIVAGMGAGEIDIAAYLRMTERRHRFVTFLHPLDESRYTFIIRAEVVDEDTTPLTILAPFHRITWLFLGSVLQQGGTYNAVDIPSRMLVGWWWLFALVITATYSAKLVSNQSVQHSHSYPFTSIQEAATSPLTPLLNRDQSEEQLLSNSDPESDLGQLWRRVVDDGAIIDSKEEAYERVLSGDYSFISDKTLAILFFAKDYLQHGHCRFTRVPVYFYPGYRGFAVPKHFPYTEQLNYGIQTLSERGFINKWKKETLPEGAEDCLQFYPPVVGAQSLSFSHTRSLFLTLVMGIGGAAVCLLVEIVIHHVSRRIRTPAPSTRTVEMLIVEGAIAAYVAENSESTTAAAPPSGLSAASADVSRSCDV
ncbi:PREDICTED: glutamate receptor ionotropic, delta-1-like [Priapulus caudatus]|uniref:Glutamate receptor ionotropic, delta-1-like n=1 Tax=Priapulus caudatus TaxID=37621 RepID=A0ABM1F1A9_PRICU|nr:PREDICTED: glutamate receptor ionotropic, delta-1-like [Priapulus caudatus]